MPPSLITDSDIRISFSVVEKKKKKEKKSSRVSGGHFVFSFCVTLRFRHCSEIDSVLFCISTILQLMPKSLPETQKYKPK